MHGVEDIDEDRVGANRVGAGMEAPVLPGKWEWFWSADGVVRHCATRQKMSAFISLIWAMWHKSSQSTLLIQALRSISGLR